jgi:hypothetical protein
MIGSLLSQMANAEKMSIEQIQRSMQNGVLDTYIGIPLIAEKAKQAQKLQMAQAILKEQGMPDVTVKDQVMQTADQVTRPEPPVMPSTPDGYRQQSAPSQGVEALASNMPEDYAGGGIIAFAEGGGTEENPESRYRVMRNDEPFRPAQLPDRPSYYEGIQSLYDRYMGQIPANQEYLRNVITSQQANRPNREQMVLANAIREAGFGAAAGREPWALTNVAEGALLGSRAYARGMENLDKDDQNVVKQLIATGLRGDELQQQALRYGIDLSHQRAMEPYYGSMEAKNLAEAGLDPERANLFRRQAEYQGSRTTGQDIENLYGPEREQAGIEKDIAQSEYFRRPHYTKRAAGAGKVDPGAYQIYQDASNDPQFQSALADALASGERDRSGNPVGDPRFWRREVQRILKDPSDRNYPTVMQYMQRLMPSYMQRMRQMTVPQTSDYSSDEE